MEMKKIKIVKVVFVILFIIALYFLLPHILPIVDVDSFVIISSSMWHWEEVINQSFFESFWKDLGVEPENLPFRYGFLKGDLLIISPSEEYKVGDVILWKKPRREEYVVHRIYKINSTHFRDVMDRCITEENLEIVTLAVKGINIMGAESLLLKPDKIYEGPGFESCSHYWMPLSYIEGKASIILPKAGSLHMLLRRDPTENKK